MNDSIRPRLLPRLSAVLGLAGLGLAAAGCAATQADVQVRELVDQMRLEEALAVAEERAERAPDNESRAADLALARSATLLEQGRRLMYESRDAEALQRFEAADSLLPGHPVIGDWLAKCRGELAISWGLRAFDHESSGDFDEASAAYDEVLRYAPGDELALAGLERVEVAVAYRSTRFDDYYNDGVRAIRGFRTAEAARDFASALKFDPEAEDAEQRRVEVQAMLADERARIAEELRELQLHRAAANEFRIAQLYAPDLEAAIEGQRLAEIEVGVLDTLDEVDRMQRAGRFEEIFAALDEAATRTTFLGERIDSVRAGAEQAQLAGLYDRAIELQSDYRFEDAIAAYDELLETAGGFYDDAISRRDTVADFIAETESLYAQYETATDDDERLRLLRNIDLLWPTYRDVEQRLAELRARMQQAEASL